MSTMQEVWGFGSIIAVSNADDTAGDFCRALNTAAASRSITPNVPSDALDQSRDIMVDEAAHSLGMEWAVVDDTLRLWPVNVTVDWAAITEADEASS